MDIFFILTSVNKIALAAFVITFLFILFEIYQLSTHAKKKDKLTLPDFDIHKKNRPTIIAKPAVQKIEKKMSFVKPNNNLIFVFAGILLVITILYLLNTFINQKKTVVQEPKSNEQLQVTSSDGIRIYDEKWQEISMGDLKRVVGGIKIFIGVETIKGIFVDKARIRINQNEWKKSDETNLFKATDRVFYREYKIATDASQLRIEAQLHTSKKGWLE